MDKFIMLSKPLQSSIWSKFLHFQQAVAQLLVVVEWCLKTLRWVIKRPKILQLIDATYTWNLNVPLPQFTILIPLSFCVIGKTGSHMDVSLLTNTVVRYVCNGHSLPQLWLCVVTFRNRLVYTSLHSKCKLTHWDFMSFYVASISWSIFERLIISPSIFGHSFILCLASLCFKLQVVVNNRTKGIL